MKPPAPVEINRARQIVDDCVDIGANAQAKELNVVPNVTDVGEGCRVVDVADATSQPGSSCATTYYANHVISPAQETNNVPIVLLRSPGAKSRKNLFRKKHE